MCKSPMAVPKRDPAYYGLHGFEICKRRICRSTAHNQELKLLGKNIWYKLDKSHIFDVNMFDDFEKYMKVPDEWAPSEIKPILSGMAKEERPPTRRCGAGCRGRPAGKRHACSRWGQGR